MLSQTIARFLAALPILVAPKTVTFYSRRLPSLLCCLGDMPVAAITVSQLRRWRDCLTGCKGPYSPWTIHQYVRCVRRFFRWLHEEGAVPTNPARRLELPRLPSLPRRGISDGDRLSMLAACDNPRDRAILHCLWSTGCRVGGLAGLCLCDLDLDRRRAYVVEKGDKRRPVFFRPEAVEALRLYLDVRPAVSFPQVFVGELRGKARARYGPYAPLQESGIYQLCERLAKKAGVEGRFNPHEFRHARIRYWLNKKRMPLKQVSQLAGHSTARTTLDIYGTSDEDELQEAFDRYS